MNHLIRQLILFFILTIICSAQTVDSTNTFIADSIKINYNPLIEIQSKFDEFELYREFYNLKIIVSIDGDPETVWLRTKLAVANSINIDNSDSPHYLSPLYLKYQRDSKFDPIRYVLGMAQVGAVGYLAFKHIKKYGFLK